MKLHGGCLALRRAEIDEKASNVSAQHKRQEILNYGVEIADKRDSFFSRNNKIVKAIRTFFSTAKNRIICGKNNKPSVELKSYYCNVLSKPYYFVHSEHPRHPKKEPSGVSEPGSSVSNRKICLESGPCSGRSSASEINRVFTESDNILPAVLDVMNDTRLLDNGGYSVGAGSDSKYIGYEPTYAEIPEPTYAKIPTHPDEISVTHEAGRSDKSGEDFVVTSSGVEHFYKDGTEYAVISKSGFKSSAYPEDITYEQKVDTMLSFLDSMNVELPSPPSEFSVSVVNEENKAESLDKMRWGSIESKPVTESYIKNDNGYELIPWSEIRYELKRSSSNKVISPRVISGARKTGGIDYFDQSEHTVTDYKPVYPGW